MKKILLLIAFVCSLNAVSQNYPFKISGTVQSEKEKTFIESATIHLEKISDSTVLSYTISDEKGNFNLEGKTFNKNVKLFISFIGKGTFSKQLDLTKSNQNLGIIKLKDENLLDEIVIKSRAPITIKKDTLEFNVKSFKTKKDANVEDLLKKLPGVEVDAEGKITVNGKPVNKILVNGKPFFGNDPSITTKNLTKEIIEKVQITDTKSKSEGFTGENGDANNKTINLTIKKENNKGWFGRVSAGAGTDDRYEGATMINRFNNNRRISVLASTNNINSPGFSFGEIQKMFGGGGSVWFNGNGSFSVNGRRFGGGQGIIQSKTAGATYADQYGKGFDINMNYFFSGSASNNETKTNRENILPDRRYFSNSSSNSNDENDNHSIDLEFDIEIDSTFLINISPSIVLNSRKGLFNNNEESLDENNVLTNQSESTTRSESTAKNFQNEIEVTKKLGKKGSFIKASVTNQIDKSETDDFNNSLIEIFGTNPSSEERNQFSDIANDFNSFGTRLTYRLPLIDKKLFLDAKYRYRRDERENTESTFDFDNATQDYTNFNTQLSSNFIYNDITTTPSVELIYKTKKWRFNFETGLVNRTLENEDKLRPELDLSRDFNNIELDAGFRYRFDSKASIYFDYSLENRPPSLRQLQPFTDVSNPLNITTGNPNLKPTKTHRAYINFNKYNWQKGTGMWFYVSGSINNNQVVSKSIIGDDLVRTTTFENVDGQYSLWGGGSYNHKIKLDSISSIKLRVGSNVNLEKNINFFNNTQYSATTTSYSPNIGFTYEFNKYLRIEPRYTINFSKTKFDLSNFEDQNFTRHTLRIRTRTNMPKKLEWSNDIQYTFNPDVAGNFQRSVWFWNATVSYSMFKDKLTLNLKAYDLLNQNTNARRTANANFIQDSESTVLSQYFMLGVSWKFNTLGKKGNVRNYNIHF